MFDDIYEDLEETEDWPYEEDEFFVDSIDGWDELDEVDDYEYVEERDDF